jgi:hypothetical protein
MNKRTVRDQWNGHGVVQQRKPIEQKDTRPYRRGRQLVECKKKQHEPEDSIDCFDGEFGGGEEQREKGDVSRNSERAEGSEISSVFEREKTEWDNDQEDCFFVDMPTKEE